MADEKILISHHSQLTPQTARNLLYIQKHRLDEELEIQAELFYHVSHKLATVNAALVQAKDALARIEAAAYVRIGKEDEKLSDTKIRMRVVDDPDYQAALSSLGLCKSESEVWVGIQEAFRQRGYMLRELCDLYLSNYYTTTSHAGDSRKRAEVDHTAARAALTEQRVARATLRS